MLNPSLIVNADTALNRGVCLSDRDIQIAISAIEYIQSRYAWDAMTDLAWDSLDGDLGQALTHILDNSTCGGGGGMAINAVRVDRITNQSGGGGGATNTVSFDSTVFDYGSYFDSNNPTYLTIPTGLGGMYEVTANITLGQSSSSRFCMAYVDINNGTKIGIEGVNTQYDVLFSLSGRVILSVGDVLRLKWYNGSLNRDLSVAYSNTTLSLRYLGNDYAT